MMIWAIHIVGISTLTAVVGAIAYQMGFKEGARKTLLAQELNRQDRG